MTSEPTTVFAHAVGFTGATLSPLASRMPGPAVCLDVVGHGRASVPEGYPFSWRDAGERILADLERTAVPREGRVGVGHSGGGTALLWAEILDPGAFATLVLYEPPIRAAMASLPPDTPPPLATSVRHRRDSFADAADFEEYLRRRDPYRRFDDEVVAAYAASGLEPAPGGGFRLACRPALEASMYVTEDEGLVSRLPEIDADLVFLRGENTFARFAELAETLGRLLPRSRGVVVPGLSHFGPLESPDAVAEVLRRELALA